jgi:membrane fusion protein (multidrug efflux system)
MEEGMIRAWVLFALLGTAAVATSCPRGQEGPPEGGGFQLPPTPVVVEPVLEIPYAPAIELVGEIRAAQRAMLSAEVGGRVVSIAHRVGEVHPRTAGALVQINPADYEAQLAAAEAQLLQAQEGLRMAETGPRAQEIAAQQAQVDAAEAQYELALDNLSRQGELYDAGVIAESQLVAAQTQADAARAALDAQQEVLDTLLEGTRDEEIGRARAGVELAESQVDQAQLALGKTAIRPAFDAVVTQLLVEVGTSVGPGTPVAEVVATGPAEAWFNLPEEAISEAHPGDAVELTLDALPDEVLTGTVISVSPSADPVSRQFPMRVALSDERALAGMVAHGRLLTEEPRPTLMIKRDATVLGNLGMMVYVMGQPTGEEAFPGVPAIPAQMVPVVTGDTYGDLVTVVEGELAAGMMVVTRGNEQLYPGANIVPINLQPGGMAAEGGPPEDGPPPAAVPAGEVPAPEDAPEATTGDEGQP